MKKEIVVFTDKFKDNGPHRVLSELISGWINYGLKVTVIEIDKSEKELFVFPREVERIVIEHNGKRIERYFSTFVFLMKYLKMHPTASIVAFVNSAIYILAFLSFFTKNRIVVSERNNPKKMPTKALFRLLRNIAFFRADACVFQTENAMKYFPQKVQRKGKIIFNPIMKDIPEKFCGERRQVIVTACRLVPQKNLKMMVDAFKLLTKEFPDYLLVIYGQGILEEELRNYICGLKLENKVILAGFSKDIHIKMNDCMMYVSSSNFEGMSNSMLEAMAMGLPTIVTDCPIGGAKAVINNMKNGILIPVGDTDALYEAMKKVIKNKEFATLLSDNAYKIRDQLPLEKISKSWIDILFE